MLYKPTKIYVYTTSRNMYVHIIYKYNSQLYIIGVVTDDGTARIVLIRKKIKIKKLRKLYYYKYKVY